MLSHFRKGKSDSTKWLLRCCVLAAIIQGKISLDVVVQQDEFVFDLPTPNKLLPFRQCDGSR
jgi:hypothetical protein